MIIIIMIIMIIMIIIITILLFLLCQESKEKEINRMKEGSTAEFELTGLRNT